ncbi:acyl-coenzyme A amino acid N-acyltransferase 1-like [Diadema antillarum]|uniref:acyl-coenzyme A amino acid N-acyltransferase 1-like n=1 Tax=Diadema antillarum TaxID=105358 RepID=UPI003A87559A
MSSPGKIAADSPAVTLTVEPTTALIDEQVKIQVRGLNPGQLVSIQTQVFTESGTTKFVSSANYRANNNGSVSVQTDPSLGGSFTGVEPMGPFWSLAPAPEHAKKFSRLIKYDVGTPFVFTFDVVDHQGEGKNEVLASATIKRCFIADYVEALPIKSGHAEGVLFLPEKRESSDPLPVVIDIRGLGMQPPMDRAALLASHGFAVISYHYLAAMVRQGVTGCIESQGFLDLMDYIRSHPRLDETRVGMSTSCFGTAVGIQAATTLPFKIKCFMGVGFLDFFYALIGWRRPDCSEIEPYGPISSQSEKWVDEAGKTRFCFSDLEKYNISEGDEQIVAIEKMECPMLMFGLGDDKHIPSLRSMQRCLDRLKKVGKEELVEYVLLPGHGHFLEAPYQPNCPASRFSPPDMSGPYIAVWGGDDAKAVALKRGSLLGNNRSNSFASTLLPLPRTELIEAN